MSLVKDLSNLYISESYQRVVQIDPTDPTKILDGTGSDVTLSSSIITNFTNAVSASAEASGFSANGSTSWFDLTSVPTGIISSSNQLSNIAVSSIADFDQEVSSSIEAAGFNDLNLPSGLISSSGQTASLGLGKNDIVEFGTLAINNNIGVGGNVLISGTLTAREYIVSSSVTVVTQSFSSGSTIFGNTFDDTHQFTGSVLISGSMIIDSDLTSIHNWTGSVNVTGSLFVNGTDILAVSEDGETNLMSNLGNGIGIFESKDSVTLQIRSLTTGSSELSMSISPTNEIVVYLNSVDGGSF